MENEEHEYEGPGIYRCPCGVKFHARNREEYDADGGCGYLGGRLIYLCVNPGSPFDYCNDVPALSSGRLAP